MLQLTIDDHYVKLNSEIKTEDQIKIIEKTVLEFVHDRLPGLALDFNVFQWKREELYGIFLGMFVKTNIVNNMESLPLLLDFAICMAQNYHSNPYHSFYHAADVAYMCFFLVENMSIGEQIDMSVTDKAILLLSALGHDVLHPGTNNLFQVNSKSEVAIKYNNMSVLEQQSADFVKRYLEKSSLLETLNLSIPSVAGTGGPRKNKIISRIVEHILQTDMIYHFGIVEQMTDLIDANTPMNANITCTPSSMTDLSFMDSHQNFTDDEKPDIRDSTPVKTRSKMRLEQSASTMSMNALTTIIIPKTVSKDGIMHAILHAADISNPARPFSTSKKWSDLVLIEFLNQGRMEKQSNLPISPNMDEDNVNQIQSQLSFVELIVEPLFGCFVELFPKTLSLMDLIADNSRLWTATLEKQTQLNPNLKVSTNIPFVPSSMSSASPSKSASPHSFGRKLSFAAGTVEIPETVQKNSQGKYRAKSFHQKGRSSEAVDKAGGGSRTSNHSTTELQAANQEFSLKEEAEP